MTKNYKILTSYVKDISSKINDTESYIYLKDNIPKYSLGIDINSEYILPYIQGETAQGHYLRAENVIKSINSFQGK